jgi:hypothetical protein
MTQSRIAANASEIKGAETSQYQTDVVPANASEIKGAETSQYQTNVVPAQAGIHSTCDLCLR